MFDGWIFLEFIYWIKILFATERESVKMGDEKVAAEIYKGWQFIEKILK